MDGNFIRNKLELTDFQLSEIAEKLGISPQNLQNKLKAKDIKVSFLEDIAAAINKSVYYFFDENDSEIVDKRNFEKRLTDDKTKSEKNVTNLKGNKNGNNYSNKPNIEKKLPNLGVPLIPIDAMAGFGTGSVQVMDYDTETYVVPEFTELNVDFMIRVKGSSMYPKYNSGDLVACKKLCMRDIFFQWNKVYVLDTEQGAIIKRIKKGEDQEHILLISENVNYDPFELHISKIFAVALVVGVIRLE